MIQALLVLETDADYVRFGIPQDRLSPILRVTSNGVELQSREAIQTALPPLPVPLRLGDDEPGPAGCMNLLGEAEDGCAPCSQCTRYYFYNAVETFSDPRQTHLSE